MNLVSRQDIQALVEASEWPCVSIYMPTHRSPSETAQDVIRFKNLVRSARRQLSEAGLPARQTNPILAPAERLLEDAAFWQHQLDGLAVFASGGTGPSSRHVRLPFSVPELVVAAGRFHLKPLMSLLTSDGDFYILALSQKEVKLYRATHYSIEEVALPDAPRSVTEAVGAHDADSIAHFHTTAAAAGNGKYSGVTHGWAFEKEEKKDDLLRFFQKLDQGVNQLLRPEGPPLVLASVDYLMPIYREANRYPNLIEEGVTGSPDALKPDELRDRAWRAVEPYFAGELRKATRRYEAAVGTLQASERLSDILPAAYRGRVEYLFADLKSQVWGTFEPGNGGVSLCSQEKPGCQDLLDLAAVYTFVNKGEVYVLDPDKIPGRSRVAALFRY